jgi:hypothetical protein
MKRILIVSAVGISLVVPAQSQASTRHYAGTITGDDAAVTYDVVRRNGVSKVKNFAYDHAPATCNGSPGSTVTGSIAKAMRLNNQNKFDGSERTVNAPTGTDFKETVTGTANRDEGHGTLKVSGDITTDLTCNTGVLNWTVTRV